MSRQPDYAIARLGAIECGHGSSVVAVDLRLRGRECSLGLERWSG